MVRNLPKYWNEKHFNTSRHVHHYIDEKELALQFENKKVYVPQRKGEDFVHWERRRRVIQELGEEFKRLYGCWPTKIFSDGIPGDVDHLKFCMAVANDEHMLRQGEIDNEEDEPGAWDCLEEDELY